jgi:hypothetical protein
MTKKAVKNTILNTHFGWRKNKCSGSRMDIGLQSIEIRWHDLRNHK